ncbi:VirB4 family type IV secretion/conjugal transfer ATPase [Lyticum sinuosum]|uniref:Type IV secretion system protein virB4 n=1 Tax=Lyticum sinuosum TaxID=1332059 RepID=A0AAE5AH99_9RICK|nr:VirB4 family type IV secretion/conjugal transfer ATPase [Lyticum sinuosum]MDZ5760863.1 Type IV secretion system protein VirB4 [Lyticum sinuosum]
MRQYLKKNFSRNFPKNWSLFSREASASCMIPYYSYWNRNTVITKNNDLVQVIKVGGFSFETADDEDLEIEKDRLNSMLKGAYSTEISIYTHIIRRKIQIYPKDYYDPNMPSGFASYLDKKWAEKNQNKQSFVNEMYVTIIQNGIPKSNIKNKFKVGSKSQNEDNWVKQMSEALEKLEETTGRVIATLRSSYKPHLLEIMQSEFGYQSPIASFFAQIVNCGEYTNIIHVSGDLSKQLNHYRLMFYDKYIKMIKHDGKEKFAGIVSIKEYSPRTWIGMLDGFLKAQFEFIITQSFVYIDKRGAINAMQLQQNRMQQSGDKAISQVEEITYALDQATSGSISFGKHHMTIMCLADTKKELDQYLSIASVEISDTGGIGVRESINLQPAFWGQLPDGVKGNQTLLARATKINSLNFASLSPFHNYPYGKASNNHWGPSVTVLDTSSGTPYHFNFHLRDVGHTMIIGPTGAGKTVLLNFFCAQSQKFQCRLFFFDKDRGAEIFIRAMKGEYTIIDPGKKCGFNPLQLPDTGENRSFLLEWLKYLVSTNGEIVTSDDISNLTIAINGNYKLKKEDRKLSNIAPFLGLGGPGTLAGRLGMWYGNGSHALIFDNDIDIIDFDKSNIFGFEMAELLRDKSSLAPVLSYIFHRINISLTGTPTMIVLDEAWALIDNPVFAPKIKDWLKVLRKLNTFVVFATQSVEDASKSQISDTLIQQTATQIFLPNLKATSVYRTAFMLSEREYTLIKTTDPSTRFFLIKQGNDAVIAKVDLSGMDDVVSVLSGRADTVIVLNEILKENGENPEIWIPLFIKKLKSIEENK